VYVPAVAAGIVKVIRDVIAFATAVETTTTTPFFLTLKLETNNPSTKCVLSSKL
jgi:hypothetical protein